MEPTQQKPIATWNTARDVWERPQTHGLFCEHLDVFSEIFPTSGMTVNGVAYELPTWEPHTVGSGCSSLLPTVTTSESTGPGNGPNKTGGDNLRTVVSLLPTTTATDAKGSRNMTASRKPGAVFNAGMTLTDAITLLPSPRASEGEKGGPNMRGSKGDLMLSSAVTRIGVSTPQLSDDGSKLWEDVPLPLPSQLAGMVGTDSQQGLLNG